MEESAPVPVIAQAIAWCGLVVACVAGVLNHWPLSTFQVCGIIVSAVCTLGVVPLVMSAKHYVRVRDIGDCLQFSHFAVILGGVTLGETSRVVLEKTKLPLASVRGGHSVAIRSSGGERVIVVKSAEYAADIVAAVNAQWAKPAESSGDA